MQALASWVKRAIALTDALAPSLQSLVAACLQGWAKFSPYGPQV